MYVYCLYASFVYIIGNPAEGGSLVSAKHSVFSLFFQEDVLKEVPRNSIIFLCHKTGDPMEWSSILTAQCCGFFSFFSLPSVFLVLSS